ncbi:GtrA-like protein [Leptospira ellinghausenii]|uniref:GtrA-like protein n=1 Tax=Leptospira ellinghausenii TaxID=1917822 RepID=A0A2P2D9V2_9LEPT|nr:GtrA-like protein [Leptospira ellinghausenii]
MNFVGFELVVFTDKSKMQIQENEFVYGYSGNGIVALETVEEAKLYNKWIAEKIEDYLGDKNLEIGAGTGTIASILSERYPLYLYEISKANNEFLKERFKDNSNIVSIGFDFLSVDETEKFSCIYSSNVLEHLEDDVHFVNKGLDLLKVGGFFVAIVPAMMVLFSSFDKSIGHYRRYTKNDIKRWKTALSNRDDIKIIASDYFNPIGAVGWYIKMKLLKQKKINKSDALLMNAIIPFVSWLDLFWFGFGQSMLIVLKKVK